MRVLTQARSHSSLSSLSLIVVLGAVTALCADRVHAEPQFLDYFPNSSAIDGNGCVNCHINPGGGGSRNSFGQAMGNAGLDWASVCHQDSDGDGQTNGQELGDPDCVWTQGANPARTSAISNPGKASSTSSNPNGGSTHTGEGEGEGSAGEGEGEGQSGGDVDLQCPANASLTGGKCTCASGFVADSAGTSCVAGTAGTWQCDPSWKGDGDCDCGCGALDPDCADNTIASCKYNDCDTWQSTQGLEPDPNDPTQCAGGTSSGGTSTVSGHCPSNANESGGACTCAAGFSASPDHKSCVSTSACPAHSSEQGNSCVCDAGFVPNSAGNACVPASTGEGEGSVGEGEGAAGEGEGSVGEGEGEGTRGDPVPQTTYPSHGCAATEIGPLGALGLFALVVRRRRP